MEHRMKTFIRTAEIWVLSKDRTQLEFGGALYGPFDTFGAGSETLRFGFGEGLPGKAWAAGHPVILKDFASLGFARAVAAKAAGLTCAAALPVFAGEFLMAVVVLYCGDDDTHVGAIELWHHDPGNSNDLKFSDGYFGAADTFEFNARHAKFPRGYGLPGRAWRAHMPLIMQDLLDPKDFLRAKQALEIGVNRGLGIPYAPVSGHTYVLTFLCARNTPIARRLEVWVPNQTGDALLFHAGDCDQDSALATEYEHASIGRREGLFGQAWFTGIPVLRPIEATDPTPTARSAAAAGLSAVIALPFIEAGKLKAITAWYF
jgi:hypothetical protein